MLNKLLLIFFLMIRYIYFWGHFHWAHLYISVSDHVSIHLCVDSVHDCIVVLSQHSWACDPYEDIGHVLTVDIPQLNVAWWTNPDSKVHGANMGPIWGRQDPGGPQVGPMNFATCDSLFVNRLNKMDWYAMWGGVNKVLFINFSTKDIFICENNS